MDLFYHDTETSFFEFHLFFYDILLSRYSEIEGYISSRTKGENYRPLKNWTVWLGLGQLL